MKSFVVFMFFCFYAPAYLIRGDESEYEVDSYYDSSSERDDEERQFDKSLFRAAKTNDLETLKTILKSNNGLLGETDNEGMTLLHVAAIGGSVDVIKYLVTEQHIYVDTHAYKRRITPLYKAVNAGQLEAVKLLIELGAEKNSTFRYFDNTLLHEAATGANVQVLKFLLPFFNINERNGFGQTPAHLAASKGNAEALHCLLKNGADPYARDNQNNTLMHVAVRSGQVDVVRELTRYKQLLDIPNQYNLLPIDIMSDMQIVRELVRAGSVISDYIIFEYVNSKKFDIVKYLVVKSGKVNALIPWNKRDCRESLLMILLNMDTLPYDMIKFILDQGADVNIKYCMNITALHRAAYYEKEHSTQIIKLLLAKGAEINSPDKDGYTPLDYARGEGNHAVFKYLRTLGAVTKDSVVSDMNSLSTTTEDDKSILYSLGATTEDVKSTTEDDKLMVNSLGATTEDDKSTTEDDKSMVSSLGATIEDDNSMVYSLGATTEDVKSTTEDDKLMIYSLGVTTEDVKSTTEDDKSTTEDDKSMVYSLGATTEDDKSMVYSLGTTSEDIKSTTEDDKSMVYFLGATTEDVKSTTEDDKLMVYSVGTKTTIDKSIVHSLVRTSKDYKSIVHSLLHNSI